jgi:hypothetical protein
VSSKYAVFASPGAIVSKDVRVSLASFRKLRNSRIVSNKRPHQCSGWSAALALTVACCLVLGASGCGSGLNGGALDLLRVSPTTVNFGSVPVGHAVSNSVNVVNESNAAVVISKLSFTSGAFSGSSGGTLPISIPAGGTHALMVGFAPSTATSYSGQLTLMDSSATAIAQIPMQGQGSANGDLSISTSTVSFSSVTVGSSATQTITLTSTGTTPVTVNAATVSGTGFSVVDSSLPVTLNPSQTTTFQVQFSPTAAGTVTGQLNISDSSAAGSTSVVALTGTGAAVTGPTSPTPPPPPPTPLLQVSTSALGFGTVQVDSPMTQSLTLTSTGTAPVTVNSAPISGLEFTIVSGSLPVTLNPNQSTTLRVQFKPLVAGTATGEITVSSNSASGGTATVALSGTGAETADPQLSASAASLSFGDVTVNTGTTQSLTLTSTGTSAVTVNSAAITGAGFTIIGGSLPATLNPTQTMTLQVQFKPTTTGTASGQITIGSNSSTGGTTVVNLSGTSTAALSPQLSVSAASLSFGSVTVNTATTQSLTLTSTGTSAVTVNSAAITGAGFTIVGGTLPATLNPTQAMTLQVQFDPTTTGTASGQITISSNSSTGGTTLVNLSGTSTAALSPQLSVSAANLSFGSVTVNTATTQSLTLASTGTSAVTVSSAAITGAGFTIVSGSFPVMLNPTQTVTLQVQFDPTVTGAGSGQIIISSDSSTGSTAVVGLSGTSTAALSPQLSVSTANLSFGSVTVNTATTQSLTLTSTGTAAVTVNSAAITGAGFTIVSGSLPVTLNPTQTVTLQVQFKPATTGADSGQITISSNSSTGSTAVVALNGTSTAALTPQLSVSAASLGFGNVTANTATTQSLTLTSTGTSAVTVNSAAITGAGFTIVGGSLPVTLNPTQTVTLQVQFDPTATGAASGQITISSNSTSGSTAIVALSGTGTAAAIPQLGISSASLSFGSVSVNTVTTQSLTLTSTGSSPVTISSSVITGAGYTITAQSFPVTLNPGQSLTIQIQFDPASAGAASGQITISSNSTAGSTAVVTLSGTATGGNPQLAVSASSISFGSTADGTATTQSLTLTSTGTVSVTVSSAAIAGAGFTIIGGAFPVTLNPTQTLTVKLQFEPTTAGDLSGQLTISSNSTTGSTAVVGLSGTGTAVTHYVALSWGAPTSSPDPVAGYNIYRSLGTGSFALINPSPVATVAYTDNGVTSGSTYMYEVKSVDAAGVESVPSNVTSATIP